MEPSSNNRRTTSVGSGAGRTRRFFGVLGVCVAVILAVGGCTDTAAEDDPSGPLTATAPEEVETTPAEPAPADEANAALEAYLEFRDAAYQKRQADSAQLDEVATGDAHLELQHFVATLLRPPAIELQGSIEHEILETQRRSGSEYLIYACEDRSDLRIIQDDGTEGAHLDPNGDPMPERYRVEYTVEQTNDRWLVSEANIRWEETC